MVYILLLLFYYYYYIIIIIYTHIIYIVHVMYLYLPLVPILIGHGRQDISSKCSQLDEEPSFSVFRRGLHGLGADHGPPEDFFA